jgi:hypothetical protein
VLLLAFGLLAWNFGLKSSIEISMKDWYFVLFALLVSNINVHHTVWILL